MVGQGAPLVCGTADHWSHARPIVCFVYTVFVYQLVQHTTSLTVGSTPASASMAVKVVSDLYAGLDEQREPSKTTDELGNRGMCSIAGYWYHLYNV